MLKQRLLTALILVPATVLLVLYASTPTLALLLGLVVLLGAMEWSRLCGFASPVGRSLFMVSVTLLMVAGEWLRREQLGDLLYLAATLWWIIVLGWLLQRRFQPIESGAERPLVTALGGLLVLVPAWVAMVDLHSVPEFGPALLLFLLVMIWLADSGAYFAGRRWGKTKLAPAISPGKTWEGVVGAVAALLLAGVVLHYWGVLTDVGLAPVLVLCVVVGLFSIVGDLLESLVKRRRGVKDSGSLLPGHGGVLDRIDSLTAALPLFLFGLGLLGVR